VSRAGKREHARDRTVYDIDLLIGLVFWDEPDAEGVNLIVCLIRKYLLR
jgi:hypothetical protein